METGIKPKDIEEGELTESDEEIYDVKRMDQVLSKHSNALWHGVPVSGGDCELGYTTSFNSKVSASRIMSKGLHQSSESESEKQSDSSDDDFPYIKRRCTRMYVQDSSLSASGPIGHRNEPGDQQNGNKKQQKNNIWTSVMADQILSSEMTGLSGLDCVVSSDRSVESYNYLRAKECKQPNPQQSSELSAAVSSVSEVVQDDVPDICDMETFGTGLSNNMKRSWKQMKSGSSGIHKRKELQSAGQGNERPWRKHNRPMHSRLGSRGYDKNRDRSHIRVTSLDEPSAVVDELMHVLREPLDTKEIFDRVVQTIGVERALEFLYETEDLEAAGGLLTLDGNRRRTPGGVYLYLVKSEVSKEDQNMIFQNQREQSKRHKKLMKEYRKKKITQQCQDMKIKLGIVDESYTISSVSGPCEKKSDSVKFESGQMEDDDNTDCFTELDPSVNIELDFM